MAMGDEQLRDEGRHGVPARARIAPENLNPPSFNLRPPTTSVALPSHLQTGHLEYHSMRTRRSSGSALGREAADHRIQTPRRQTRRCTPACAFAVSECQCTRTRDTTLGILFVLRIVHPSSADNLPLLLSSTEANSARQQWEQLKVDAPLPKQAQLALPRPQLRNFAAHATKGRACTVNVRASLNGVAHQCTISPSGVEPSNRRTDLPTSPNSLRHLADPVRHCTAVRWFCYQIRPFVDCEQQIAASSPDQAQTILPAGPHVPYAALSARPHREWQAHYRHEHPAHPGRWRFRRTTSVAGPSRGSRSRSNRCKHPAVHSRVHVRARSDSRSSSKARELDSPKEQQQQQQQKQKHTRAGAARSAFGPWKPPARAFLVSPVLRVHVRILVRIRPESRADRSRPPGRAPGPEAHLRCFAVPQAAQFRPSRTYARSSKLGVWVGPWGSGVARVARVARVAAARGTHGHGARVRRPASYVLCMYAPDDRVHEPGRGGFVGPGGARDLPLLGSNAGRGSSTSTLS